MLFWLAASLVTFLVMAMVALPLLRPGRSANPSRSAFLFDRELYLARIREIGEELALGRIGAGEADAARAEEGRKLIGLADAKASPGLAPALSRFLALAAILFLPAFSVFTYVVSGFPGMPDMAVASRPDRDPSGQTITQLLDRAEAQLAANPSDIRGWTVVAPVYLRLGRIDDAVLAWRNAARLDPADAAVKTSLAEALTFAGEGVVSGEAKTLFEQALALRPGDAKPRFYLAMALGQQGLKDEAVAAWNGLIADAPAGAPWLEAAKSELAALDGKPAQAQNGPSAEQIAAAADMTPEQRRAMIEGMVAGLAERLAADPSDREGWKKLARARGVLGDAAKLEETFAAAAAAFPADAAFIGELRAIAGSAGATK